MRQIPKLYLSAVVTSLGLAVAASISHASDSPLDFALLHKIESSLKLPNGAKPLVSYDRYYAYGVRRGRKVLVGVFLDSLALPGIAEAAPGLHILEKESDLPVVHDGGCSVVTVVLDPHSPQEAEISCSGVA
jgi:hypothetical protein